MSIQLTSSPMRFERVHGMFVVTCLNIREKEGNANDGEYNRFHQAMSRKSFSDAKRIFWDEWKIENPDFFLVPRNDA